MSDQRELEFALDDRKTGFRLESLEILNWGTFHNKIFRLETRGFNSLLTGDIGSGKSTVIDAVTTLLVPHQKITFNKAAGSEKKERTLLSYIRGEHKNMKDENNISQKVYLRDENTYTVLLGVFYNSGYTQTISLAQVFWIQDHKPQKLFILSAKRLSIEDHFTGFGRDIRSLRKQIGADDTIEMFKSFSEYSSRFRSYFGIRSEKALDLFFQTVSLKQVGNLTDFIRNQMLEKTDGALMIEDLKRNFENLTRAHDAVIKAKGQLEKLKPIDRKAEEYEKAREKMSVYEFCRQALPSYISTIKYDLLSEEIRHFSSRLDLLSNRITGLDRDIAKSREEEVRISAAISGNKEGRRIKEIETAIVYLEQDKQQKLVRDGRYQELSTVLELSSVTGEEQFYQNLETARTLRGEVKEDLTQLLTKHDDLTIEENIVAKKEKELSSELESLRSRPTQIPRNNLDLRRRVLDALELSEEQLPFAGELIRVKREEEQWQGAAERLLHNFGLSMMVPGDLYKRVSNYVNKTDLKGRLVYFKVNEHLIYDTKSSENENSLVHKLEIKGESHYYHWLEAQIAERFNFICCDSLHSFYHHPYAITKEGQIKSGKYRHEKDDRKNIFDKRNYILGWDNKEKIRAVEIALKNTMAEKEKIRVKSRNNRKMREKMIKKERNLDFFIQFDNYSAINWQKEAGEIEKLTGEKKKLESSSNQLQALQEQLGQLKEQLDHLGNNRDHAKGEESVVKGKLEEYTRELQKCTLYKDDISPELKEQYFPEIRKFIDADEKISIANINEVHTAIINRMEKKITSYRETRNKHYNRLLNLMSNYKRDYPEETLEVDLSEEAIGEFRGYLKKIETDDLPRFEQRFRELLKEKTIQDIALFSQKLDIQAEQIVEKIENINKSLKEIEYNPGTYITLITDKTVDVDIRNFKLDLKNCLDSALDESDIYSEDKFKQVKTLLDRFNEDVNWTVKVTDVRNWFLFTASEKWAEDDTEKEFYSTSSGKSGGQKEKLAYTILASALAYQFGLEWNTVKSRSFRFVVIDEAFGRGSDESTRYGLELFKKLNLQLLIVTPLQKINIIENYIKTIHFVYNPDGRSSQVKDIDIVEYKRTKALKQKLENQAAAT